MMLELSESQLEQGVTDAISNLLNDPEVLTAVHEAIASRVHTIVLQNIGDEGVDRPFYWKELSRAYAKRVKRSHATMLLTGDLRRSIQSSSSPTEAVIWQDDAAVPYGPDHQFGKNNMPYRPYFPIMGDGVTAYTEQQIELAAAEALETALASRYDK